MPLPPNIDVIADRYELIEAIGTGGFAVVYRAFDHHEGRVVALKLLTRPADGYDVKVVARFSREIRLLAALQSPHTVRLFGAGDDARGLLYAVFEYLEGEDLAEHQAAVGRLRPEWVVHISKQVLSALKEAHDAGLLHRDIKPQNIRIVQYAGDPLRVKLLDFGVARLAEEGHPAITDTGELVGTPRYMSPEQLTDAPLTPASDIYSLGLVMMELLAGSERLPGNRLADQLERVQSGYVLSADDADYFDPALISVIHRMTARRAPDRFASAAAALAALDAIGEVTQRRESATHEAATVERTLRTKRSNWLAFGAGVAVAAIAGGVIALWPTTQRTDTPPLVLPASLTTVIEGPAVDVADVRPGDMQEADAGAVPEMVGLQIPHPKAPATCGTVGMLRGHGYHRADELQLLTYVPTSYQPGQRYPIVVLLHQAAERPEDLLAATGFEKFAERDGAIVIAPDDGFISSWKSRRPDIATIKRAVDAMSEDYCVDPERVFIVGQAEGGKMAFWLSCEPWVAGIVVNSGRMGVDPCETGRALPTMILAPTKSDHIPIQGGKNCSGTLTRSFAAREKSVLDRNGCRGAGEEFFGDHRGSCRRWTCDEPVVTCLVAGGQGWPGSNHRVQLADPLGCDGPIPDFPSTEIAWDFMFGDRGQGDRR